MAISDAGRGLVRCLGVTAAAVFALAASQQRAEALSLASPGTAPAAKYATDGLTTEVRHGGGGRGGGGFRGGGGGGFRGGGFHGGGFRAAARRFTAAGSGAVGWRSTGAVFAQRPSFAVAVFVQPVSMAAVIATDTVTPTTGPSSITGVTSIDASMLRRPITAIRLLWLPASLLPRDLDLLRAAQDLQISSLVAPPLLRIPGPLLVRAKMKRRPVGRLFLELQGMRLDQSQSLPRQGLIFHGVIASIRHCSQ